MKTPKQFYTDWNNKGEDIDKAYGMQCVDGWKIFLRWCGYSNPNEMGYATGDNAGGIWKYPNHRVIKDFQKVTDYRMLKDGDWVVWYQGSQAFPHSHVAMYYQGKCFGMNQSKKVFSLDYSDWVFKSMAGAFRWKKWEKEKPQYLTKHDQLIDELARRTINGEFGNGEVRQQILAGIYKEVQDRVNQLLK